MSADYPHLHSAARPFAEENSQVRIRRIRTDRWITYARAEAALSVMEDLLHSRSALACRTCCW